MARIRTIKPEFFSHELLGGKSAHARLLAIGLLTLADCEGRLRWVPMQIHAQVFPWEASVKIETLLMELIDASYLVHYEVDGKRYVQITNFRKHQRLSGKEAGYESIIPAPPEKTANTNVLQGENGEAPVNQPDASRGSVGNPLGTGEHRNIGTGEHRNIGTVVSCSELAAQTQEPEPSACKFPMFPTSGKIKTWSATADQIEEWKQCYPAVDINAELRKAHAWVKAHLKRRKTASGMPAFLVAWFNREQNSPRSTRTGPSEQSEPARPKVATAATFAVTGGDYDPNYNYG
jgi:hypothetical protein